MPDNRPRLRMRLHLALCCFLLAALLPAPGCSVSPIAAEPPSEPLPLESLRDEIDAVLDYTLHRRTMSLETNAAWQILHGVLAFGADFWVEGPDGPVNVVEYLQQGGLMRGWTLRPTQHGLRVVVEPGTNAGQGHPDQWLAILAQAGVSLADTFVLRGRTFTAQDMLDFVQHDSHWEKESSWSLIIFTLYLDDLAESWQAQDGTQWNVARVMFEAELASDIPEVSNRHIYFATCGGTHRLIGLTMALNRYRRDNPGKELTGVWKLADDRIQDAIAAARDFQLSNGEFSVYYFERPAAGVDVKERLAATGTR